MTTPITPVICKRPDCCNPMRSRGMCAMHYNHWNYRMAKKRKEAGASRPKTFRDAVFSALPGSMTDLMAKTGIGQRTVQKWLRVFKLEKVTHIIDWRRPVVTGAFVPVYGAGGGPDAACKLVPHCATSQSAWARRKATMSDDQRDMMLNKERTRKRLKSMAGRCDPMVAALFGMGAA